MTDPGTSRAILMKELPAACESCGYSLRGSRDNGSGEGRCPECGSPHGGETLVLRPVALRRQNTAAGYFGAAIVLTIMPGVAALTITDWSSLSYVLYLTTGYFVGLVFLILLVMSPALICMFIGLYRYFFVDTFLVDAGPHSYKFNHALRLTDREIRLEQMGKAKARSQYELIRGITLRAMAAGQWELRIAATGDARYEMMVIFHADDKTAEAMRAALEQRVAGLPKGVSV